jgi:filamentous hemagglutinin
LTWKKYLPCAIGDQQSYWYRSGEITAMILAMMTGAGASSGAAGRAANQAAAAAQQEAVAAASGAGKLSISPQSMQSAIRKIQNAIRDHVKPGPNGDISGVVGEMTGNYTWNSQKDRYWDHIQEMNNTINGLRKHMQTLEGVADAAAQAARQLAIQTLQAIEEATMGIGI